MGRIVKITTKFFYILLTMLSFSVSIFALQGKPNSVYAQSPNLNSIMINNFFQTEETEIAYSLYLPPNYSQDQKYSFVLFLHGAGDRGKNHDQLLSSHYGFVETLVSSNEYKNNTIILIPQCPEPYLWVDASWDTGSYTIKEEPTPALKAVKLLMDQIVSNYSIDNSRIYACGVSMGGMGVWDLLARYPQYFAAAAPICGALDETKINEYLQTPIFTANDLRDTIVGANPTCNVMQKLKNLGADVVYKIYDAGVRNDDTFHSTWIDSFQLDQSEDNVYNFLFSRTLNKQNDEKPIAWLIIILTSLFSLLLISITIILICKQKKSQ